MKLSVPFWHPSVCFTKLKTTSISSPYPPFKTNTFFSSVDNEQKDDKRNWEKNTRTILFFDKSCPKIKPSEILKRPKLNASKNIYSKV